MIYEFRPARQNAKARLIALVLFLLVCTCVVSSAFLPYPTILQAVGVILLVPVIQLVARYVVAQYLYRLRELEDGSVDLEVYLYRGGDKMQLVCRVSLLEIVSVAPYTKENVRAPKGIKRYNYCMDIAPAKALVLSVSNADGACEVLLSPDAYMEDILNRATKMGRPHEAPPDAE